MLRLQSKETLADWIAILGLVLTLCWFCDGMIFADKIPLFRDLGSYFYPIKFSVAQAFHRWELPLWDRHMAAGFPVMAGIQSGVFYPPSAIFALLPFFSAIRVGFLFHYSIAVSGSFILFRWWKCPPYISAIGAILFTFGGTIVSLTNVLNHFQSAVWLPWGILLCERTLIIGCRKNLPLFVLVLLCQFLGGSPEIFAMSLGLMLVDAIRLHHEKTIPSLAKALGIFTAAGIITMGLSMVQLLPALELISRSRRHQAIPTIEAYAWSLQPWSLIGLLAPMVEADTTTSLGVRLLFSDQVPFLISHYLGIIVIVGTGLWLRYVRTTGRLTLLILLIVSLCLAFGRFTPVYPFLYEHIALLRVVRFPEKFFFLTFALLIFVAVRGLSRLSEIERLNSQWPSSMAICLLSAWSVVYVLLRWNTPLLIEFLAHQGSTDVGIPVTAPTLASIFFTLERQIALSLVVALLFILNRFRVLRAALFEFLLVITVFLDLAVAHKPLQFLRDADFINKAPRILASPPADHSRLFYYPPGNSLHPSYLSVLAKPSYDKTTALPFNNLLPNAGILFGFEYFQDIDALAREDYNDFLYFANPLPREKRSKLLGALSVRYLISFRQLEIPEIKLVKEFPEHFSWLYEIPNPVPRVYVVSHPIYDQDPMSTLRRLASDDFDPRREVVVDAPTRVTPQVSFRGDARIKLYQNDQVQIDAQLNEPGMLVLTDAFYPGWKAFVDGKEQKILRANYLFRAVELGPGNHNVEFVYDPISFKIGLLISSLPAALLIVVPAVGWMRRKSALRRSRRELSQPSLPTLVEP